MNFKDKNQTFVVDDFILSFSREIKFETFNDPDNYYGIVFISGRKRYEVLSSKVGTRLLISGVPGEMQDLPFNMSTASFLPDFIGVKIQ